MDQDLQKSIIVAEDDTFLLKVYETKLTRENYQVISAINGEEAVSKIKEYKPDVVLLDLIMPIKDGFEVLEIIKSDPETKNIPVVVLSNLGQESDTKRALDLGAATYIVKSNSSIEDIVKIVKEIQ